MAFSLNYTEGTGAQTVISNPFANDTKVREESCDGQVTLFMTVMWPIYVMTDMWLYCVNVTSFTTWYPGPRVVVELTNHVDACMVSGRHTLSPSPTPHTYSVASTQISNLKYILVNFMIVHKTIIATSELKHIIHVHQYATVVYLSKVPQPSLVPRLSHAYCKRRKAAGNEATATHNSCSANFDLWAQWCWSQHQRG